MSYQFLHIEGYARSAGSGKAGGHSAATIAAEAERQEGACPHVEKPLAPVIIFGGMPSQAVAAAHAWADQSLDSRGHKMRKDGLCMLAGVISAPKGMERWAEYKKATVAFLRASLGDRLESVIEHKDEKERHLHFYAVPRPGERFEVLHPGRAAAAAAKAQGKLKGEQNREYKSAMRRWQDHFWQDVSSRFGLARIGPGRRRLTRRAWKDEQDRAKLIAEMLKENKELKQVQAYQEKIIKGLRADPEKNPIMRLKQAKAEPEKVAPKAPAP